MLLRPRHRFFTRFAPVNALWEQVLGAEPVAVVRATGFTYYGKYFRYPLQAAEALPGLESGCLLARSARSHSAVVPMSN